MKKIIEKSKGNNVSEQIKKEIGKTSERKDTEPLNIKNVSNNDQVKGSLTIFSDTIILSDRMMVPWLERQSVLFTTTKSRSWQRHHHLLSFLHESRSISWCSLQTAWNPCRYSNNISSSWHRLRHYSTWNCKSRSTVVFWRYETMVIMKIQSCM